MEQEIIAAGVSDFVQCGAEKYIAQSNEKLPTKLATTLSSRPNFSAASQDNADGEQAAIAPLGADGSWILPARPAPPGRSQKRARFASDFGAPDVRRRASRAKTAPEGGPWAAASCRAEAASPLDPQTAAEEIE